MDRVKDVSEARERNAEQWLAWARRPDHDAYHWRFNFPQFTELLRFHDAITRDGLTMTFDGVDRPLSDYTAALTRNGFVMDRLTEPRSSAEDCRA